MKKLGCIIVLFFAMINLNAQCLNSRKDYNDYFEKNLEHLDIIEGFWSVTSTQKFFLNGELIQSKYFPQDLEYAIIKSKDDFICCYVDDEKTTDIEIRFTKTVNPLLYFYKRTFNITGEIVKANAVMTSTGILEYSYQTGTKELIYRIGLENYKKGLEVINEVKLIKTYPTKEVIQEKQKWSGTGFAISSNGLIITNSHVVNGGTKIKVRGINGDFSKSYPVKIIAEDKNNDLAIIQINDSSFKSLEVIPYTISNKSSDAGISVFVLGYPLKTMMGDEIKLTNGIISSKSGFQGDITSYQISAPIQPGNSGGPLFDSNGNLIGIVNAKLSIGENVSYAIKSSYLLNLIDILPIIPKFSTVNLLTGKQLSEQVKMIKKFVYIIEVN
jgi:S1-C subfamily serine protease